MVAAGASPTATAPPSVAADVDSAKVGEGGKRGSPAYSITALAAPTGLMLVKSMVASAQPISPALICAVVGGHTALGSAAWEVGSV